MLAAIRRIARNERHLIIYTFTNNLKTKQMAEFKTFHTFDITSKRPSISRKINVDCIVELKTVVFDEPETVTRLVLTNGESFDILLSMD